jgi:hypothetical protein
MQIGHGHGIEHAYITGKVTEAHGHQYVVGEPNHHVAATAYPHTDSVENITKNYRFSDADSWPEARENFVEDHPASRAMREDIRQNGIKKPILIDYDQHPPEVVDGHMRLWHAEALGMKHVPVEHSTFADAHYYKDAARWMPHERLFGPTQGLDHRLFDGEHLKSDVRKYILETLYDFWKPLYGADFDEWSIVYFAGSEASEWTSSSLEGNNDFDVLIGVDYIKMRGHMSRGSRYQLMSDQEITDEMNRDFKRLDEQTAQAMIPVGGELVGPFSNTWYVNPHSYDIRAIKPYAAYDVTHDKWAVKPPELPDWDIAKFPEGPALVQECQAVAAYVRSILRLPEPYKTQQGFALWQHLHGDRSRAFSDQGEGWYDPGNVIEKWLDQEGLWEKLVQIMVRAKSDPTSLNAPQGWSNDPLSGAS